MIAPGSAAAVTGPGSMWSMSSSLSVDTSGSLTVGDGGCVAAGGLLASFSTLHGDGTITASGGVLDADLRFDSTHGLAKPFTFGSGEA